MVAYRLILGKSIVWPRSFCPHCNQTIFWHDNIPVFSWLLLGGKCRFCKKAISFLYPMIELFTALSLSLLYLYAPANYFLVYFIFFSALIITIRSDIETMLISGVVTLFLIPVGFLASYFGLLPITLIESVIGSFIGYLLPYSINKIFKYIRHKDGIGEGDFDLLAFIGSFTGIVGVWFSITIGSLIGSLYSILILLKDTFDGKKTNAIQTMQIPFGPFLSIGAIIFVFIQSSLIFSFFY